ncbi:hypothetical protein C8R43DRAFT_1197913 [Mycena crocata]|nr:hypothetical protein C8R43DRAFT_1197913 [Mycena crocata]
MADSGPPPRPLQDISNSSTALAAELDTKNKEIEQLLSVVKGLTKKKGRGRKRARILHRDKDQTADDSANDEQDQAPSKKSKSEASVDYIEYGRLIARYIGPFVDVAQAIEQGTTADSALSGDELDTDVRLIEAWTILWKRFPGFHAYLLSLSNKPIVRRAIIRQIVSGIEAVRQQDTACLKNIITRLLLKIGTPLEPPLADLKNKTLRGMAHPVFAAALTPMDMAAEQSTYEAIVKGDITLTGSQLPRFIFPLDQAFPVGVDSEDPVWLDVFDNALKGEIVLRSAKALLMGPDSALEVDGYHKGRPGNAKIIGLESFTPRVIAWVVTQVYFALSSKQEWGRKDGDFDYDEFFWTIHGLFEGEGSEEWAKEIIDLWNKVVLGTKPKHAAAVARSGPSTLAHLKAARAAKHAAASASSPPAQPAAASSSP